MPWRTSHPHNRLGHTMHRIVVAGTAEERQPAGEGQPRGSSGAMPMPSQMLNTTTGKQL
ncbi:acetyl-CoA acetyltransferase domain protein [Mycobacterium xenopi 3993]|nr:acetyl-CoA acetyltransferase domain protein [Mycobacterium xenopi 3993]